MVTLKLLGIGGERDFSEEALSLKSTEKFGFALGIFMFLD